MYRLRAGAEFSLGDSGAECPPFLGAECQHRAVRVPRIADEDLLI
jgi:hypothetical protein